LERKEEALEAYDLVISIKENHLYAWKNRGIILAELGRAEEALFSYEKAI